MSSTPRRSRPEVVKAESRLRAASERMMLTRAFGVALRDLRLAAGLTRARLAGKCRISSSTLRKIEVGHGEPSLLMILILCDGLGVNPDALIGGLPVPQERRRSWLMS
jgi:transcriptional regulator with XRE-family HTH domain